MNGPFDVAEMGMMIGLISIIGTLAVVLIIVLAQLRNRRVRAEMLHKERLLAIEKGIALPSDDFEVNKKRRPYVGGLVWAGVGLALLIWGFIGDDSDLNGFGLVPLLVGIALLVGDYITARGKKEVLPKSGTVVYPEVEPSYRSPDNPS